MASKCEPFIDQITSMVRNGKTNVEISRKIGLNASTVSQFVRRKLCGNLNYLKKKTKHNHLHREILVFFLKHTEKETQDKFNLTQSEFKSCMTCAYKRKEFSHIRKDNRQHSQWSEKQYLFLLKYSGVVSRCELSKYIKRGRSEIVIKEKLQKLNICSKTTNGIRYSQFISIFSCEPDYILQTTAGSNGRGGGCFKLVPWCHVDEMLSDGRINCSETLAIYFSAMAMFQRWIHGENYWQSLTAINRINKI